MPASASVAGSGTLFGGFTTGHEQGGGGTGGTGGGKNGGGGTGGIGGCGEVGGGETGGTTVTLFVPFVTGGKNPFAGCEQIVNAAVPTMPAGMTLRNQTFHSDAMTSPPVRGPFPCCG